MTSLLLEDRPAVAQDEPYLSFSRFNRYLTCPEQYRLYYIERLRPRFPSANLLFGKAIHQALAHLFQRNQDPVVRFVELWQEVKAEKLTYSGRDKWETLDEKGRKLLDLFLEKHHCKLGTITACEAPFRLDVSNMNMPLVGVIDLIAEIDAESTVIDFKTSGSSYADYEADLSDQLSVYSLARPDVKQCAFCVLVKTKEPRIEWQFSQRNGQHAQELIQKIQHVIGDIASKKFDKRKGKWCSYCDYLPVCLDRNTQVKETLVQID